MSALLGFLAAVVSLAFHVVLLGVIVACVVVVVWVLWDCTVGPSAQMAAAARHRARRGGT